jgi:hypothetical protein
MKYEAGAQHGQREGEHGDSRIPPGVFTGRCSLVEEPIVESLFRGFSRWGEAEERLNGCVSDDERLVLEEHLKRVKRELQQQLDTYVDGRVQQWLAGHVEPRHSQ